MKEGQDAFNFAPGDYFDAVVVGYDDLNRQLLLSKKRAGLDPVKVFPKGLEIEGEVAERTTWGFVVHLREGVDGELRRENVPDQEKLPLSIRLQQGDRLRLEVTGHDPQTQMPQLSLNCTIARHQAVIGEEIRRLDPEHKQLRTTPVMPIIRRRQPLTILLVDDEKDVLEAVGLVLRKAGHTVCEASSRESALNWLALHPLTLLDVVLLDLQLQGVSLKTPEVPLALLRHSPNARVFLLTGNEELLIPEEARDLRDHVEGVIPKGDAEVLLANVEGRKDPLSLEGLSVSSQARAPEKIRAVSPAHIIKAAVKRHLPELTSPWPRMAVLVAEYNREGNVATPLAGAGFPLEELSKRSHSFLNCELGGLLTDAEERHVLLKERPSSDAMDWLRTARADQVVGRPMKIGGYPRNVGIYFFIGGELELTKEQIEHRLQPRVASLMLDIERDVLHHKILTFQKAASTGSLVLGMTHELKNLLLPVDARLMAMLTDIDTLAANRQTVPETLVEAGARLRDSIKSLTTMMEGFLRMTRGDVDKLLPLDVVLTEVVELCADSGRQFDVFVAPLVVEEGLPLPLVPSRMRQVFMNIILNAIQHCDQTKCIKNKLVQTRIALPADPRLQGVSVRITDNGYGVAAGARDQIFDMFYTTRQAGSGLGLYVAKDIVESVGGWIGVDHQSRYRDNTFAIFIPTTAATTGMPAPPVQPPLPRQR